MARLGCLLMMLAIGGLMALVVLPVLPFLQNSTAIDDLLTPLVCESGEKVERDQYTTRGTRGGTTFTMSAICVDANGQRRDVTDRWTLISMGAFLVPFLGGMFLLIGGAVRRAGRAVMVGQSGAGSNLVWVESAKGIAGSPRRAGEKSLAERLKQAQEARDKGLITIQEYERLRQEILDEGV